MERILAHFESEFDSKKSVTREGGISIVRPSPARPYSDVHSRRRKIVVQVVKSRSLPAVKVFSRRMLEIRISANSPGIRGTPSRTQVNSKQIKLTTDFEASHR